MPTGPGAAPLPSAQVLAELNALYDQGRYLDAHELCRNLAPAESWPAARGLVLAGRLFSQWGDSPRSNRLHQRAWRLDPADPFVAYFNTHSIWSKHGIFEALLFVRKVLPRLPAIPETREQAYLWLMYATLLGHYRDFSAAEPIFERVLAAFPTDPWLRVDKTLFLQNQDRYGDALAVAEDALRLQPNYRPAVQSHAHLLHLLERDEEAIAVLRAAATSIQSAAVVQLLISILEEKDRLDELPPLLDLAHRYLPEADRDDQQWLGSRRFLVARQRGDLPEALAWARRIKTKFYETLAGRLENAKDAGRRVLLPVRFVRQHHNTCAPATLTALSQFWNVPADHEEIARQICYDGTFDHVERDWAEKAGWVVREFRPTWESARALIDRGCPFAVVTVETDSAHMQAIIGYDSLMGTLLIRDPYLRQYREWAADNFFEVYAAHGPRAMVMVPAGREALLTDLPLADTALYDHYYKLQRTLHTHDRDGAGRALEALRQLDADHLLTLWGGYLVTNYDGRLVETLALTRRIRAKHPNSTPWQVTELRLLDRLGDQAERRKLLHAAGAPRNALVALRRELAEDLARDARQHARAHRILRATLRREAVESKNLRAYANLLWSLRDFPEATEVYRLAACRADKVEYHWDSYFIACRHLGQPEEALALLRSRVTRWGARSSQPVRTLFDSLNALDRTDEAFAALQTALPLAPHDGEVLLFAAERQARHGRHDEALALLETARGREARAQWLRTAARIADYRRDHPRALAYWRELAALNFADTAAHSVVAQLLAITEGEAAALAYLRGIRDQHPQLLPLHQTLVERLRKAPAEEGLAAVERMIALDPADAWALREKALILRRLRRLPEALATADEAVRIAPHAPASHGIRADVLVDLNRPAEAHAGYCAGLRLSIDADWLFDSLINVCADFPARVAAVNFLHGELLRQNSLDHACLPFRTTARTIMTTEQLTGMLRTYHEAHPEIWAGWSALGMHLLETGDQQAATALLRTAAERFPLTPHAWTDLANVHAQAGSVSEEIACIQKALAISPAWSQASRQLAAAYERLLQLDQAEHVLRRAVAASPLEAANHAWLADVLWRRRKFPEALASVETALSLSPEYNWAWERLEAWSRELGEPARAADLARRFTESRAGEAGSWLRLVRIRFSDPDIDENLRALDRAAQLMPLDPDVWDLRAQLLAENLRYDEALAACQPAVFAGSLPHILDGRRAWIEHRRGEVDAAIKRLKGIVEAHPDYTWGWSKLTEWHDAKDQFEEVRACAEKWAWLVPAAAAPHGYLGYVHQRAGRRAEAKAAYAKAIALDPQYAFGVGELLRMRLEDSEFDAARQVLQHYATHYPEWVTLRAEVRFAAASSDRARTGELLARFAPMPAASQDSLAQTVHLLLEKGWPEVVDDALQPTLTRPDTLPHIGDQWMKARQKRGHIWRTFWRLWRIKPPPAMRSALLGSFVSWLGEANAQLDLRLARLLWSRELREGDESWGQVGYALATCGQYRGAIGWMKNWRQRATPPHAWMLSNLVLACQCLGRWQLALETLEAALALPADHVREKLLNWRALEHALAGETAAAGAFVSKINATQQPRYHAAVLAMTRQLLTVQNALPEARSDAAREAHAALKAEAREYPPLLTDPGLKRLYKRTLRRLGQDGDVLSLRIRSHLPQFQLSASAPAAKQDSNHWVWFIAIWVLLGAMRGCVGS